MSTDDDPCSLAAFSRVTRAIEPTQCFPQNVFSPEWEKFFFFDADWMLEGDFVQVVHSLLDIEQGSCACLLHFTDVQFRSASSFRITRDTNEALYDAVLSGTRPGDGWLYNMARIVCGSNLGQWCLYCEQQSEMAVLALKKDCSAEDYKVALSRLHALPIAEALERSVSYAFSKALLPEWRKGLLLNYRTKNGIGIS